MSKGLDECLAEGKSILQCQLEGGYTETVRESREKGGSNTSKGGGGITNLSKQDIDCASDSLLGFITEPFCVAGKSITKGAGPIGALLSNRIVWVVIAVIVILALVAFIRRR